MTAKRFTTKNILCSNYCVWDNTDKPYGNDEVVELLNELHEENEQLKEAYTQLKHRHSLLHDECIDAECDRDSYRKDIASLEKENERLRKCINGIYTIARLEEV